LRVALAENLARDPPVGAWVDQAARSAVSGSTRAVVAAGVEVAAVHRCVCVRPYCSKGIVLLHVRGPPVACLIAFGSASARPLVLRSCGYFAPNESPPLLVRDSEVLRTRTLPAPTRLRLLRSRRSAGFIRECSRSQASCTSTRWDARPGCAPPNRGDRRALEPAGLIFWADSRAFVSVSALASGWPPFSGPLICVSPTLLPLAIRKPPSPPRKQARRRPRKPSSWAAPARRWPFARGVPSHLAHCETAQGSATARLSPLALYVLRAR